MGGVEERAWNWFSKWFNIDTAALIPEKLCYEKVFQKSLRFLEWIFMEPCEVLLCALQLDMKC